MQFNIVMNITREMKSLMYMFLLLGVRHRNT